MKLSRAQVRRFWREWPAACRVMHWTRADGLSAAEIDARRKEFLARCGFGSLTEVDRVAGFTRVLNELLVLQGTSLSAARETVEPERNVARVRRHVIANELMPCLGLYVADVAGYVAAIVADKTGRRAGEWDWADLDAGELRQLQFTLAARLNTKRRAAGDTVRGMKLRAGVPRRMTNDE